MADEGDDQPGKHKPPREKPPPLRIGGEVIEAGRRKRLEIPVSRLPTETWLSLPVEVVHGKSAGPRLWLAGAVHGDELNGVEIIREVLGVIDPKTLQGTLVAVPIVNVFGFINQSRYLPDRRDLNRSFPGSQRGSMAARLAYLFMTEIVNHCTHGIDLHTGSNHRTNLPQIRADLSDAETRRCAEAFAAPVTLDTHLRDGSLRGAAAQQNVPVLLYEAGEPLRFDATAIQVGFEGVLRVMQALNMHAASPTSAAPTTKNFAQSTWVRARRSGIMRLTVELGQAVEEKQSLGMIADAFGDNKATVRAAVSGIVIGHTNNPLVHQGDAIVHIAHQRSEVGGQRSGEEGG